MNHSARLGLLALAVALAGCAALEGDKIDYKSAPKGSTLEVPPDLTQLARDNRYNVPGGVVSANALQAGKAAQPSSASTAAISTIGDVRIERDGNQRWLVVNRPADKLWEPVRDFWLESGFTLDLDQANLGIMETDWAENRAKLPQDAIRSLLGKVLDSLYSTGERDRFRTRLERNPAGGTDIFITHRGMIEVYSNAAKDNTAWQPRPNDPELETEFLRRLMVKLGMPQEQAKAIAATPVQRPAAARMARINNAAVMQLDEGFDRAWRRVGLSLDRTGFTVEDRNRNEGLYFVRYVAPDANKKDAGFFGKWFGGSSSAAAPLKFRIVVRSEGNATTVSVLDAAGAPAVAEHAERIVRVLVDDLK